MGDSENFKGRDFEMAPCVSATCNSMGLFKNAKPIPRMSLFAVLVLLGILFVAFAMWVGSRYSVFRSGEVPHYFDRMSHQAVMNRDIRSLKRQFGRLLADSFESKLNYIEQKISSGTIGKNDVLLIKELKKDLKTLENYALYDNVSGVLTATSALALGDRNQSFVNSNAVLNEIASLQNLFYVGIASLGLLVTATGGIWLRIHYRIKKIDSKLTQTPLLIERKTPNSF